MAQRAEVTLIPPVAARENHVVRVEFEMNPQFGLRVPVRLAEASWAGGTGEGKATYRNYRRFETSADRSATAMNLSGPPIPRAHGA